MRNLRIKNLPTENGFFHVVCRTVGKAFLFDEEAEKRRLLMWLEKAVDFCGVELLSWCVMSNHVHLLVKVPPRQEVSDAELDRRMRILYLPSRYNAIMGQWSAWTRMDGSNARVEEAKAKLRRRMYDISWFMKTFKQAEAQDYSARHDYSGSLWGGTRFKSVYLEGSLKVLLAVAAYIHLNPVRADMVPSAEQYPWSSWGQACAQPGRSRMGLQRIYAHIGSSGPVDWKDIKAQLEDVQSRICARRDAVEALANAADPELDLPPQSPKSIKQAPSAPIALEHKLVARAPEFSGSVALGSASFVSQYLHRAQQKAAAHLSHRHLVQVAVSAGSVFCTIGTRSLGRPSVAYRKQS